MQKLDTLRTRACCAPLPREINNYYSRCHGKMKDKSDCKGSCYCESHNCSCPNKGLTGHCANTNTCNCSCCCATPKENIFKSTCPKCKKPKEKRYISPTNTKQKNICRCCSPQPPKQPAAQSLRVPKAPTEKKYILCYKQYEEGDSMLELPIKNRVIQADFKFDCQSKNVARNQTKDVNVRQEKNTVCTCGLVRPCECRQTDGMWCKGGGMEEAAPPCRRCGKKVSHCLSGCTSKSVISLPHNRVYAAEKLVASGGAFHTSCYSCYGCHKALEVANLYESQGEIYCKQCYAKYFGMSGYGYGTTLLSPV